MAANKKCKKSCQRQHPWCNHQWLVVISNPYSCKILEFTANQVSRRIMKKCMMWFWKRAALILEDLWKNLHDREGSVNSTSTKVNSVPWYKYTRADHQNITFVSNHVREYSAVGMWNSNSRSRKKFLYALQPRNLSHDFNWKCRQWKTREAIFTKHLPLKKLRLRSWSLTWPRAYSN